MERLAMEFDPEELEYMSWLEAAWAEIALGAESDRHRAVEILHRLWVLERALGPARARRLRHRRAREWWRESGRCPWCGDVGVWHDPETPEEGP